MDPQPTMPPPPSVSLPVALVADVQDALVTILSEKTLPIPELASEVQAVQGFNLVATANDRDRGVNELSSALRRRGSSSAAARRAARELRDDMISPQTLSLFSKK